MEYITELFSKFTIEQIILFALGIAFFLKKYFEVKDDLAERARKHFTKGSKTVHEHQVFNEKLNRMNQNIGDINSRLDSIESKMNMLINSDEYDIKSYITDKHRLHVVEMGWIDNYTMDNLERRFAIYEKEGGNSFIAGLMKELRQLPRVSPEEANNDDKQ